MTKKGPRINRKKLLDRCRGYCEVGGEPLGGTWAVHHRKLRSQGGDNRLSNLLAVCHDHHNLSGASIHVKVHRSYSYGWLLESWKVPEEELVRVHGKHWALLTNDGRYDQCPALQEGAWA